MHSDVSVVRVSIVRASVSFEPMLLVKVVSVMSAELRYLCVSSLQCNLIVRWRLLVVALHYKPEVARSIPDGVIGIFDVITSFSSGYTFAGWTPTQCPARAGCHI